jgi:chaperonin GroEL
MHATKAAVEEGIVPGGGVALLRASAILESFAKSKDLDHDERLGIEIVRKASEEPTRWIAQNAGVEGSIVAARIKESKDKHLGFNAQSEEYEDLVKVGVIDPTKVVRTALTNAASIAALLLTTEALVSELPEKKEKVPAAPGAGMDDY